MVSCSKEFCFSACSVCLILHSHFCIQLSCLYFNDLPRCFQTQEISLAFLLFRFSFESNSSFPHYFSGVILSSSFSVIYLQMNSFILHCLLYLILHFIVDLIHAFTHYRSSFHGFMVSMTKHAISQKESLYQFFVATLPDLCAVYYPTSALVYTV